MAKAKPKIAAKQPANVKLEAGRTYAWCACGLSKKQPFCDGAHVNSHFMPVMFKAKNDEEVYLCQCKRTNNQPFCDGTHNTLGKKQN